jgi:hypothetical protein
MNESDFSWHPILPHSLTDAGMHLKRGGALGDTYAAVTCMPGRPWLAIFNLHQDTTRVRSVTCESEMEAIQIVEHWLEGVVGRSD